MQEQHEIAESGRKQNRLFWHHLPVERINLLPKCTFLNLGESASVFNRSGSIAILNLCLPLISSGVKFMSD